MATRQSCSAGVSINTYGQIDVQQRGAILNNASTIVQTQQAGMINGTPNLDPGHTSSADTVRGFDGETKLAAARGFYWRNEHQVPLG